MHTERTGTEVATADVILWQTAYRLVLALLVSSVAVVARLGGTVPLSPIAASYVGVDGADWLLGLVTGIYTLLVIGVRSSIRSARRAGAIFSSLIVAADVTLVSALLFVLAPPSLYHVGLLVGLFSLQLTHIYFGTRPALSMLVVTTTVFLGLNLLATQVEPIDPGHVLVNLILFGVGGLLVVGTQSDLQTRLGVLVGYFTRAEEGDFDHEYDVARDIRPDAVTAVGRAFNRMKTQLAGIVTIDPLTGCFNRRSFEQQFQRELARAVRTKIDLALLTIDLDDFKKLNEAYGHLAGDQVIREVGAMLKASARAEDVVTRTGGEEFTIIAPGTPPEGAQFLATRILESFRRRTFLDSSARIPVRVSIGMVSERVPDDHVGEAMRARADEALVVAKRAGRDRAVLWSPGLKTSGDA